MYHCHELVIHIWSALLGAMNLLNKAKLVSSHGHDKAGHRDIINQDPQSNFTTGSGQIEHSGTQMLHRQEHACIHA
jgi:hypothetical protein